MAFDGIVTKCIVSELNKTILNSKVNKIFEPTKNDIMIGLYNQGINYCLHICIDPSTCRLNLTTHTKPNPFNAPNFCMLLRKHLIGSKIVSISSFNLDRIVEIDFECLNEMNDKIIKKIYIEIMGSCSNIILTNDHDTIIDAIRHTSSNREIMPARIYSLPENTKNDFLSINSFDEFKIILSSTPEDLLAKKISDSFIGICRPYANYILSKNNNNLSKTYEYLKNIVNDINSNKLACKNNGNDYVLDFSDDTNTLKVNFFIDDYYYEKDSDNNYTSFRNDILKIVLNQLKKCTKKLDNINNKLAECKKQDEYKLYGELITANLYKLKENVSSVELENYYDNNKLITIPMDETISPSKNAEKYFKKYNKLKNTLEIVSVQKSDTQKELNYIESIVYSIENARTIPDLEDIFDEISENLNLPKSKEKSNKSNKSEEQTEFLKQNINGFTVLIGKNNKQNDELTLKVASKDDYWFHTQDIHGSHVILKTEGKEVDDNTLFECAKLAMQNSKAKLSSNVPVDYTLVKFVKKPSSAKPGMVVYTNYKTIYV